MGDPHRFRLNLIDGDSQTATVTGMRFHLLKPFDFGSDPVVGYVADDGYGELICDLLNQFYFPEDEKDVHQTV